MRSSGSHGSVLRIVWGLKCFLKTFYSKWKLRHESTVSRVVRVLKHKCRQLLYDLKAKFKRNVQETKFFTLQLVILLNITLIQNYLARILLGNSYGLSHKSS